MAYRAQGSQGDILSGALCFGLTDCWCSFSICSLMKLSETQKASVIQWVRNGDSLANVQNQLQEEFDISMTYMDIRFLVDDLDIELAEPSGPAEVSEMEPTDVEAVDDGEAGRVKVEVDVIMRPGALVSGTVTFSDGVSLNWQLSASGQLGLIAGEDSDYRPSMEDMQSFQSEVEQALQRKGY